MTFVYAGTQAASHKQFFKNLDYYDTSVAPENDALKLAYEKFVCEFFMPISRESIPVIRFQRLKEKWEEETIFLSSVSDIAIHPSYQQIIGMGSVAVPFILREMEKSPGQWFWALKSITGADPVPSEQRGNVMAMTKFWLKWGKERGYID